MLSFDDIQGRVEREYQLRTAQIGTIKKNMEVLRNLTDSELRIFQKSPYFKHGWKNSVWPLTNFLDCNELVKDPAFQNLYELYIQIEKKDKFVGCGTKDDHPLQPIYRSLSELATRMAKRGMTEPEYKLILKVGVNAKGTNEASLPIKINKGAPGG